jgi:hypothetical protein
MYRIKNKDVFRLDPEPIILFILSIPVNFVFEGLIVFFYQPLLRGKQKETKSPLPLGEGQGEGGFFFPTSIFQPVPANSVTPSRVFL